MLFSSEPHWQEKPHCSGSGLSFRYSFSLSRFSLKTTVEICKIHERKNQTTFHAASKSCSTDLRLDPTAHSPGASDHRGECGLISAAHGCAGRQRACREHAIVGGAGCRTPRSNTRADHLSTKIKKTIIIHSSGTPIGVKAMRTVLCRSTDRRCCAVCSLILQQTKTGCAERRDERTCLCSLLGIRGEGNDLKKTSTRSGT